MVNLNKKPKTVIEYVKIILPDLTGASVEEISKFKHDLTIQIQGQAVELSEKSAAGTLALVLPILNRIAQKVISRQLDGQTVLFFDHNLEEQIEP